MAFVEKAAQHGNAEAQLQLGKLNHLGNHTFAGTSHFAFTSLCC